MSCFELGFICFLFQPLFKFQARSAMLSIQKAKKPLDKAKVGFEIIKNFFVPELPAVSEFTSGETMGKSGDRLAAAFGVSRR